MDSYRIGDKESSLTIFNAFTGVKVIAPFNLFTSMESFKVYIAQSLKIDVQRLFLLTPLGIKLKFSMIVHEQITEVYAFDRKFFTPTIVKTEKSDIIIKDLLSSIENDILIYLVKPRASPLSTIDSSTNNINNFIHRISSLTSELTGDQENGNMIINSSDLDFDSLRLFLNLLKRNSGWASALVADMKSTLFNDVYHHDYEIVENIMKALNSLIQYITNLLSNLEKEFSTIQNVFYNIQKASLSDKWEEAFELLENICFSYTDKATNQIKKLHLSKLIDLIKTESAAKNSKMRSLKLQKLINELLSLIKNDIMKRKETILKDYESYKTLYLKPEWEISERENIIRANQIYQELENAVSKMVAEVGTLPSFEELITTSNQMSTFLSQDSIKKIINLVNIYNRQSSNYIPTATKLADALYKIQCKFFDSRKELQMKIVNTTLISIVEIQLLIRDASNLLNNKIITTIEKLQKDEVQLTLVNDLPLIFGIWSIAVLGNKKYGVSLTSLSRKSNEIFEMLNFIEQDNRKKWLNGFIESVGNAKSDLVFLNAEKYRNEFILQNLFHFVLIPDEIISKEVFAQQNATERNNLDAPGYLFPFNKLIQNINGFPIKGKIDFKVNVKNESETSTSEIDNIGIVSYFSGLIVNVCIKDITQYIHSLGYFNYDQMLVLQLTKYMENIGINNVSDTTFTKSEVAIKSGNLDDLGTFDVNDKHYMKIFQKFIKSFESRNIKIDIKIRDEQVKDICYTEKGLIKFYEERIKKLENLLGEKKVHLFNHLWSDVNSENYTLQNDDEYFEENEVVDFNGALYGRNTFRLPPAHFLEKISELERKNKKLSTENSILKEHKEVNEVLKMKKIVSEQENRIKISEVKLEEKNCIISSKDHTINTLKDEIRKLKIENEKLRHNEGEMKNEIDELKTMSHDLLENMSHKEIEFLNEAQINQKEKNVLNLKIEELTDMNNQYEKVLNKIKETDKYVRKVISILSFAMKKLQELTGFLFSNLNTTCLVLEIMGLLLVRKDGNIDIQRIKGLRLTKKNILLENNGMTRKHLNVENENAVDDEKLFLEIVASELVQKSKESMNWLPNQNDEILENSELFCDQKTDSSGVNVDNSDSGDNTGLSHLKIKDVEDTLEILNFYELKFKAVVDTFPQAEMEENYNSFIENTLIEKDLVLQKVHKRFEDVETLARKLQHEKIQLRGDIKSLTKKISQQLVLRNFQRGDLVLFLRTLSPPSKAKVNSSMKPEPWAIFNIGSPNYYLKVKSGKDQKLLDEKEWFVARIKSIDTYTITDGNKDSLDENPFNFSVGTVWNYVETKQESI